MLSLPSGCVVDDKSKFSFLYRLLVLGLLFSIALFLCFDSKQNMLKNHINNNNAPIVHVTTSSVSSSHHQRSPRLLSVFKDLGVAQANMQVSPCITSVNAPERRVVIDVGSNNGEDYAVNSLKRFHKVYSFEPMPPIWSEFKSTLTAHNLWSKVTEILVIPGQKAEFPADHKTVTSDKLYFIHAGASDSTGKLSVVNRGLMTSIIDQQFFSNPAPGKPMDIATVVIDDYIDEDIYLFKTDTQGNEFAVLKGAEKLLRNRKVSYLTLEFWPAAIRNAGADPVALLYYIYDLGFDCVDITNNMHNNERHVPLGRAGGFEEYVKVLDRITAGGGFIGLWDELFCWRDV